MYLMKNPRNFDGGGNDAYTVLLINCDGVDASTTFTDTSVGGTTHTITVEADAQVDTAQKKFGTGSAYYTTTADGMTIPDSSDFAFGSGNFTIDFWARFDDKTVNSSGLFAQRVDTANRHYCFFDISGTLYWKILSSAGNLINVNVAFDPTLNQWYHFAFVRNGNNFNLYIDGTSVINTSSASAYPDFAADFLIGSITGTTRMNGWLDEIRISKGIARWKSDFTPPTKAYY